MSGAAWREERAGPAPGDAPPSLGQLASVLAATNRAVEYASDRTRLLEEVCRVAVEGAGFCLAWVGLVDDDTHTVRPVAHHGAGEDYVERLDVALSAEVPEGRGPTARAVRARRPEVSNDIEADPRMAAWRDAAREHGLRSSAAVPLVVEGAVIGALNVYSDRPNVFTPERVEELRRLSSDLAFMLRALRAVDEHRRSEQRFRASVETLLDGFALCSSVRDASGALEDFRLDYLNAAAAENLGLDPRQTVGRRLTECLPVVRPLLDSYRADFEAGRPLDARSHPLSEPGGGERFFDIRATQLGDGLAVAFRDVTERVRAERRAARRAERDAALAALTRTALGHDTAEGVMAHASRMLCERLPADVALVLSWSPRNGELALEAAAGTEPLPPEETRFALGESPFARDILHSQAPVSVGDVAADPRGARSLIARDTGAAGLAGAVIEGREAPYGLVCVVNRQRGALDADGLAFVGSVARVLAEAIERIRVEDEARRQALTDRLTGLPNRTVFLDRLAQAIERAGAVNRRVAVALLDVDHFQRLNDSAGHRGGDAILRAIAPRMAAALPAGDTLARFGGDQFLLLLEGVRGEQEAMRRLEAVRAALDEPVAIDGTVLRVTASIGVALGGAAADPDVLVRDAGAAMHLAKRLGRDRCEVFGAALREQAVARVALENDLRRALEHGELVVHYQPIVRLADGGLAGLEALVRWHHPQRGLLGPGEFLGVALESRQLAPLGACVIREVCRQLADWGAAGTDPGVAVSINLSGPQLTGGATAELLASLLAEHGLRGDQITLEITESTLLEETDDPEAALGALRAMGARLALDDFGTGYSSLSYLARFPVDELKVDRSFIAALNGAGTQRQLVGAIVGMARGLGLAVVAEGIETEQQRRDLIALGCDLGQGFLFSAPVPAAEFAADWLTPPAAPGG